MPRQLLFAAFSLLLLVACSRPNAAHLELAITSHEEGQVITGSREVTIAGQLSSATGVESVLIEAAGSRYEAVLTGNAFAAGVILGNNANEIRATAKGKDGESVSDSLTLHYPFIELETFQTASVVIGQPDFETGDERTPSSESLGALWGNPLLSGGRLYAPDRTRNRILVFDEVSLVNGAAARHVLGQPDFETTADGATAVGLSGPQSLAASGGRILVADGRNNRVLIWNEAPTTERAAANVVLGQTHFATSAAECSPRGLFDPESLTVARNRLIVADTGNQRVLIWNEVPQTSGVPADLVLGQASFDTCALNDDDQDGTEDAGPTSRTLHRPTDVWSDGERLMVADADNFRVLIWNSFPESSFTPADVVIGQPDFHAMAQPSVPTSTNILYPYFLDSNGNQVFVADAAGNRLLVWNSIPAADGTPADVVLGQEDFESATPDGGNAGPSARTLNQPRGVSVSGDTLIVSDGANRRYLLFE